MTKNTNFDSDDIEKTGSINSEFSAGRFVEELLSEGEKASCDETSDFFKNNFDVPPFHDGTLYKKGQDFFHRNIASFFISALLGLIVLGSRPAIKLLIMTQKQSTPMRAYKRYLATILHMLEWYKYDVKPGSKSWISLKKVRQMHNSASKQGQRTMNYKLNQLEMALTQFGFIGFAIVRGRFVGLHEASKEDLKNLIHVWRVLGYALGIEDRFNVCRESVEETEEIFEILIRRIFMPNIQEVGEDFYEVGTTVAEGFKGIFPGLQLDVLLHFLHMVMVSSDVVADNAVDHLTPLDKMGKWRLKFSVIVFWTMKYQVVKFIINTSMYAMIWFWRNFPFLGYWKFGMNKHSHVSL